MKLSIITVNLNNKAGLSKTIKSVLEQDYPNFEYIIVDGGSTDGSVDIIQQYSTRIARWTSEPDRGIYDAMNKGISYSSGQFLLFLNSGDTLIDHTTLRQAAPYLDNHSIIYGDLRFDTPEQPIDYVYPDKLTFQYFFHQSLGHPATFIHRSLFDRLGLYDQDYPICADWVFFTKAICLTNTSYRHIPLLVACFDMTGISNNVVNQEKIKREKDRFMRQHMSAFYDDYHRLNELTNRLDALKSSKAYRVLRALGVKKFR